VSDTEVVMRGTPGRRTEDQRELFEEGPKKGGAGKKGADSTAAKLPGTIRRRRVGWREGEKEVAMWGERQCERM